MISIRNMLKIIRHLSILFTLFFCYILPLFFGILVIYTESEVRNKLDCFLNVFSDKKIAPNHEKSSSAITPEVKCVYFLKLARKDPKWDSDQRWPNDYIICKYTTGLINQLLFVAYKEKSYIYLISPLVENIFILVLKRDWIVQFFFFF